jgi:putative transposase
VAQGRAGRWHIAFAVIPAPVPAPGNDQVVGIDRGVAVSAALSTGQMLRCPALTALNIAAGLAVTARGAMGLPGL